MISRGEVESKGMKGVSYTEEEDCFVCKTLDSFYICVDKEDYGYTPHAKNDGYWESWITAWTLNNVKSNFTVLDIGANHGYYSLMLAQVCKEVDAYEPQEKLCNLINKSKIINNFNNLNIYNSAISNKVGEAEFMVPIHHGMNGTLANKFSYAPYGFEIIKVSTDTLDNINKSYDFIKIDAEGGENLIWEGMQNYIENNPHTLYLIEWRYDRYEDPENFAHQIFNKFNVSEVDVAGHEVSIDHAEILFNRKNEDWMLVLRKKNEGI